MPEIEFAFLADSADARPGEKFHVLGGGVSRLGAHTFPFRHPHLALVIDLLVTSPELEKEHDVRFALLAPTGPRSRERTASSRPTARAMAGTPW